jgi:glutamine amidotransferase
MAWLGPPRSLSELLLDQQHSLYRQSWAPRRQRYGTVNADGFGVGWYAAGRSGPVQFRRAQPIWTDRSFASLAPAVNSGCVLAAVRSATPPQAVEESGTAPFLLSGGGLFSHNGAVDPEAIAAALPPSARADAPMDSAMLAALVSTLLDAGTPLSDALAECVLRVRTGRLNLLATNGQVIAATTWGDTLCWIHREGGVLVCSEPDDDDPAWIDVPDRSLLTVSPSLTVDIRPLEAG